MYEVERIKNNIVVHVDDGQDVSMLARVTLASTEPSSDELRELATKIVAYEYGDDRHTDLVPHVASVLTLLFSRRTHWTMSSDVLRERIEFAKLEAERL